MRAILVLVIFAAVAPTAQAASLSVPATVLEARESSGVGTVALAGSDVVWIEARGTSAVVMAAGQDGVPRQVAALPARAGKDRSHKLVASGTTAVLQRMVCRRTCTREARREVLRIDLATGVATSFDPCPDEQEKAGLVPLTLRGSVLGADCATGGRVLDLADGASSTVGGYRTAADGAFVARIPDSDTDEPIVVENWRTGAVVSRVAPSKMDPIEDLDVDADGTLAFIRGFQVHVVAPGGRTTTRPIDVQELELAGGLLATREHSLGAFNRFRVGDRVVEGQDGGFGWAFDGARLAWVAQPCAQTVVQVWDLAAEPPTPAESRCATATVGRVRLLDGRVRVRLRCPATAPAQGCAGFIRVDLLRNGRKRGEAQSWPYKLAPGRSSTESLGVEPKLRRPLTARVHVNDTTTRRRVR